MKLKLVASITSLILVSTILYGVLTHNPVRYQSPSPGDVLFKIRGSHSGLVGGVASESAGKEKLPTPLIIGRTWVDDGPWTDHSYKFSTYLLRGTKMRVDLNSSAFVSLRMSVDGIVYFKEDVVRHEGIFKMPVSGTLRISLSVDRGETANINMTCDYVHWSTN